jgi:hypothetical protein
MVDSPGCGDRDKVTQVVVGIAPAPDDRLAPPRIPHRMAVQRHQPVELVVFQCQPAILVVDLDPYEPSPVVIGEADVVAVSVLYPAHAVPGRVLTLIMVADRVRCADDERVAHCDQDVVLARGWQPVVMDFVTAVAVLPHPAGRADQEVALLA